MISYCGNTSKSDLVPGTGKQINYYKQRVILKCTSSYPVNKDLMSSMEGTGLPSGAKIFITSLAFSTVI